MSQIMSRVLELKKMLARFAKSQLFRSHLVTGPLPAAQFAFWNIAQLAILQHVIKAPDKGGFFCLFCF